VKADLTAKKTSNSFPGRPAESARLAAGHRRARRRALVLAREAEDAPRIAAGVAELEKAETEARAIEVAPGLKGPSGEDLSADEHQAAKQTARSKVLAAIRRLFHRDTPGVSQ